tara:strand:+ start:386 stop:592 length:207 start_codon:yes stop_codon:yes gene_type:complete
LIKVLELPYQFPKSTSSLSDIFILLLPADATTIQPAAIAFSAAEEVVVPGFRYAPLAEYDTSVDEEPL